jgi:hypothetical protein
LLATWLKKRLSSLSPTSDEAEAIFWHDMDPDVIRWSNDEVMGDREVIEICPAGDKHELTPLGLWPARQPKEHKTIRVSWAIEVEAETPLFAARRARFYQTQPGMVTYGSFRGPPVRRSAVWTPVTIDLTPDGS